MNGNHMMVTKRTKYQYKQGLSAKQALWGCTFPLFPDCRGVILVAPQISNQHLGYVTAEVNFVCVQEDRLESLNYQS